MSATNPVSTRADVYAVIDGERAYQDSFHGNSARDTADENRELGSMILLVEEYVAKSRAGFGKAFPAGKTEALHALRKAAALAVACMEYHGALPRE